MRKMILSLLGLASVSIASAQLSFGVKGNYTMYKGEFQQKTPGFGGRVSYDLQEKMAIALSYTHGLPINTPSSVLLSSNNGSTSKSVASEINFKFKTFSLLGQYSFVGGDPESAGKFYGFFGPGFVFIKYDETIKESYDRTAYVPMDQASGSESGFTLNLGLGGEYQIGTPRLFAEAGLALPANKVGNTYVENYVPAHFSFNVGIKIPLGGGSDF